jgi:hypothetical protein
VVVSHVVNGVKDVEKEKKPRRHTYHTDVIE